MQQLNPPIKIKKYKLRRPKNALYTYKYMNDRNNKLNIDKYNNKNLPADKIMVYTANKNHFNAMYGQHALRNKKY